MLNFLKKLFSFKPQNNRYNHSPKGRSCKMEMFEERTLLSAVPLCTADYVDQSAQYAAFSPSENLTTTENTVCSESILATTNSVSYNAHDVDSLRTFLEKTDESGETNGQQISKNYDADDPSTWNVTWSENDSNKQVTHIEWIWSELVGDLDLSGCTALVKLKCYRDESLTGLDVSGCTVLEDLQCFSCDIESLNVSGCTALNYLDCSNNTISELDLTECTALTELDCCENTLSNLNLSGCTQLSTLKCYDNQITGVLNISGFTNLRYLYCWNQGLKKVVLPQTAIDNRLTVSLESEDSEDGYAAWTFKDSAKTILCDGTNDYTIDTVPFTASKGSQKIEFLIPSILDINGDLTVNSTDAQIVNRYLSEYTGTELAENTVSAEYLNSIRKWLDIDGNGEVDLLTDGLLFNRYVNGYRGDALIANAIGKNATRTTAETILQYFTLPDLTLSDLTDENTETESASGKVQKVYSATSSISTFADSEITIPVTYKAMNNDGNQTGLGLRIHYDSTKLTYQSFENLLEANAVGTIQDNEDTNDEDGDSSTDRVLIVSWQSLDGKWPGSAEQLLMNLKFKATSERSDSTNIHFTASSTNTGYTFDSESITVNIKRYDQTECDQLKRLYTSANPGTWEGITWQEQDDGIYHAVKINRKDAGLDGSIDFTGFTKLTHIDYSGQNSLKIENLPGTVKTADQSTFTPVITLDSSQNENKETVSENVAVLNEWSTFDVELWTDFSVNNTFKVTWDASVFDLDFADSKQTGITIEEEPQEVTGETVSNDGRTTRTFVLTTQTGYTANVGETLAATLHFKPVSDNGNVKGGLETGKSLNSAICVDGEEIQTQVYSVAYDMNNDGSVGIEDLVAFAKIFGQSGEEASKGNFDGSDDGVVGITDLVWFAKNFGLNSQNANQVQYASSYKQSTSTPASTQAVPAIVNSAQPDLWAELEDEEKDEIDILKYERR